MQRYIQMLTNDYIKLVGNTTLQCRMETDADALHCICFSDFRLVPIHLFNEIIQEKGLANRLQMCVYVQLYTICVYVSVYAYVCGYVCVCEREREREIEIESEGTKRDRYRKGE